MNAGFIANPPQSIHHGLDQDSGAVSHFLRPIFPPVFIDVSNGGVADDDLRNVPFALNRIDPGWNDRFRSTIHYHLAALEGIVCAIGCDAGYPLIGGNLVKEHTVAEAAGGRRR